MCCDTLCNGTGASKRCVPVLSCDSDCGLQVPVVNRVDCIGCVKVATGALAAFFLHFGADIFSLKTLEVQDLKKYVLMKIRRKWVKKVRPCKILMVYFLRPYG